MANSIISPSISGRGVSLTIRLNLMLWMRGAMPPTHLYVSMLWCIIKHKDNFTFWEYFRYRHFNQTPFLSTICSGHERSMVPQDNHKDIPDYTASYPRIQYSSPTATRSVNLVYISLRYLVRFAINRRFSGAKWAEKRRRILVAGPYRWRADRWSHCQHQ